MGAHFITEDGALDRATTRERAFSDKSVKLQLEAILHPLIHEEVEFALCADAVQRAPYAMLAVPLLFETLTYRKRTQRTLLIDCPVAAQLERVKRRSSLSAEFASRIVDAQLPRDIRLQLADDIIWNGGIAGALHLQVESFHILYTQRAGSIR